MVPGNEQCQSLQNWWHFEETYQSNTETSESSNKHASIRLKSKVKKNQYM